jgi:hypothetical protein
MTELEATSNEHASAGSRQRIRAPSARWIGFSEDDASMIAEGADIRRHCRSFLQRAEDNAFHLCASCVGYITALWTQRPTAFGIRH